MEHENPAIVGTEPTTIAPETVTGRRELAIYASVF